MKKIVLGAMFALTLSCAAAQGFLLPARRPAPADNGRDQALKFVQFYGELNKYYVDTLDNEALVADAIKSVLGNLDPHSVYLSAEELKESDEAFKGGFGGVGIGIALLRDTLLVVNVVPGTPAERAGIRPNDRVVAVDGRSILGEELAETQKKLRGPRGSHVAVDVVRRGEKNRIRFVMSRDIIPINSVDAAYKMDEKTGYIRVSRFANTTMQEFERAFNGFGDIDALILDLRDNGGGILEQGIAMSNFFLPSGSAIVSAEGRAAPPVKYVARTAPRFPRGKLVVLMDESSASASEIVAGAIQDWDRGVVIGRRSFGKGLVQTQVPLLDGSAVRITVAHYYTPSGRSIQRPFEPGKKTEYYTDVYKRFNNDADSIAGQLKYKTLRLGRDVFSGGGIYPDIYVHADTAQYSKYWAGLFRDNIFREYVLSYMDTNQARLAAMYKDYESFERNFVVDKDLIDGLIAFGEERGVAYDEEGFLRSRESIELRLKANIADKLWSVTEFYRVIQDSGSDPVIEKAKEVLRNWDKMSGLAGRAN